MAGGQLSIFVNFLSADSRTGMFRQLPICFWLGGRGTMGPISPDQDICIAGDGNSIAIQDHHNPLSQHGIASYVTKFESKSFRLHSNSGVALCSARKLLAQSGVSVCVCV